MLMTFKLIEELILSRMNKYNLLINLKAVRLDSVTK